MKVLIIDDDKATLSLYGAYFRKEHQVVTESDSQVAMETFAETQPDVVLLNDLLPAYQKAILKKDGFSACGVSSGFS